MKKRKKCKLLGAFLAISMLMNTSLCAIAVNGENVTNTQEASNSNFTNLIVFARFAGEDEFVDNVYHGLSVKEITDNSYNTATYSVGDYYRNASADQLRMNSVYLFDNGGSLQLTNQRGYYAPYDNDTNPIGYTAKQKEARGAELREDWTGAINQAIANGNTITNYDGTKTYNFKDLDKNGDGRIDAITVIYKNESTISVNRSDLLWNYKDIANDYIHISLENGKEIESYDYVQLTNNYDTLYQASDNKKIVSLKTSIHEMGHIFGLKDLYKSPGVSPIYYLSAMSNAISPVPQGLTIKEKEALGWTNGAMLKEIVASGQYQLKMSGIAGTESCVGYKVDIPKTGKTLYLEYRNFSSDGNKYDNTQNKALTNTSGDSVSPTSITSGLVCYLAQTDVKFPSNLNGSAGNWAFEALGGSIPTKVDAALTAGQALAVPGGITVRVDHIEGDTLTFQIEGKFVPHEHTGGIATCSKKAICEKCGEEYGDYDTTRHLHTERRGVKEATQEEEGYTGDLYCVDCNIMLEKGKTIDKLPVVPPEVKPDPVVPPEVKPDPDVPPEGKPDPDVPPAVEPTPDVKPEAKPPVSTPPIMLNGEQSVVIKSETEEMNAEFRSSAPIDTFLRVEMDGVTLVQDQDYTVRSGSTIVSLVPSYIASLSDGEHQISIVSTVGTASAKFSVLTSAKKDDTSTVDKTPEEDKKLDDFNTDKTKDSGIKSPQCGEKKGLKFWVWKIVEVMKKAW